MTGSYIPDDAKFPGEKASAASPLDLTSDEIHTHLPQRNIGRYEVARQLGKGGFGFVYLAWDPKLLRNVAVKVPRWDKPLSSTSLERFLNEGQMLAQVEHPAIATVHDVNVTDDGVPYVVMQYIEGRSLSEWIKSRQMTADQKLDTLVQIAEALKHAHQQGVTHRDLKPANVIIDSQQRVRLVDFGLALHEELSFVGEGESGALGTPAYMSPEQIRGENHLVDGRTDIWAFGVTMYVMLTLTQPFRGAGYREMLRAICYKHPRPLRQIDEHIPRELDRICLRCLQKLMEDRYPSMADVLEELRAFIADTQREVVPTQLLLTDRPSVQALAAVSSSSDAPGNDEIASKPSSRTASGSGPASPSDQFEIVPKGLRTYDQNDHEFFLRLLPGPVDRYGVPESIRFWLARLGVVDQVDDVPIGLIYGPSGCGKSSFVRAGLLPQLTEHVLPIYIDCTTENLTAFICERIRREVHDAPAKTSLLELLRMVRQGHLLRQGDKLLLVLDQFEQWLNRCSNDAEHPLTAALRQCDGMRVQALLLIRDDFWISASQFLRCLDRRIEEGKNAMSLPLFDERHARRVLEALGRAYGALPSMPQPLTPAHLRFIRQVVQSLSQRGKVVCVHLTVFAETTKGADWSQLDFRALGGWEGIGREYIAGVFNDPQTPAYIKRHSGDAWRILQALLPESEPNMKGRLVRRGELRMLTGLDHQGERFEQLMNFLEFEAHLISPMEDEEAIECELHAESTDAGERILYGLTHDFLVSPVRSWGAAKDSESHRGRAENLLRQLCEQWTLTDDNRFLPSIWDFARIAWFASREAKQGARDYWKAARWRYNKLITLSATVIVASLLSIWMYFQDVQKRAVSHALGRFVDGPTYELLESRNVVVKHVAHVLPDLEAMAQGDDVRRRLRAQSILLEVEPDHNTRWLGLVADLEHADPGEFIAVHRLLEGNTATFFPMLMSAYALESSPKRRARLAISTAYLKEFGLLQDACQLRADPSTRTEVILEWTRWHGDFDQLLSTRASGAKLWDGDVVSAVCCAMSLIDPSTLSAAERSGWLQFAQDHYVRHPHAGAHFAAFHLLEKWGASIPIADASAIDDCQWRYFEIRLPSQPDRVFTIPMARIEKGTFPLDHSMDGSNHRFKFMDLHATGRVDQDFWMAVFETPVSLVQAWLESQDELDETVSEWKQSPAFTDAVGKQDDRFPVPEIDYATTCRFINWLNTELGFGAVYDGDGKAIAETVGGAQLVLPTVDQFELALRAKSETKYFFGDDVTFLRRGVDSEKRTDVRRTGRFMPNGFGLFDMIGNYQEWTGTAGQGFALVKGGNAGSSYEIFQSPFVTAYPSGEISRFNTSFRLLMLDNE